MAYLTHRVLLFIVALLLVGALGTYLLYPRPDLAARDAAVRATQAELRDLLHPTLHYDADELRDEDENAYPPWKQAFTLAAEIGIEPWQELLFDLPENVLDVETFRSHLPEGEEGEALRQWLAKFEPVFELLDEALERPVAHIPATETVPDDALPWEWAWGHGMGVARRAAALEMHLAVLEDEPLAAIERARLLLATARKMRNGQVDVIHYLTAMAMAAEPIQVLVQLAGHPDVTDEQQRDLMALFDPNASSVQVIKRAIRREINTRMLPGFLKMAEFMADGRFLDELEAEVEVEEDPEHREETLAELAMHRRLWERGHSPLDLRQSVNGLSQINLRTFELLAVPGGHRELMAWRDEVTERRDRLQEALDEAVERGRLPRPPEQRENVIGRLEVYDASIGFMSIASPALWHDATVRMAHVGVAALIFEREHGHLPESLEQLIEAGLISEVPADPFDGKPLRYSARHRLLWSIGSGRRDLPLRDDADEEEIRSFGTGRPSVRLPPPLP